MEAIQIKILVLVVFDKTIPSSDQIPLDKPIFGNVGCQSTILLIILDPEQIPSSDAFSFLKLMKRTQALQRRGEGQNAPVISRRSQNACLSTQCFTILFESSDLMRIQASVRAAYQPSFEKGVAYVEKITFEPDQWEDIEKLNFTKLLQLCRSHGFQWKNMTKSNSKQQERLICTLRSHLRDIHLWDI